MEFKFKNAAMETKYNLIKACYKQTYLEYCKGHYKDDRRIFINIYRQLIRFLLVSDKIYDKSVLMDCAINDEFSSELEQLNKIKERFSK